VHVAQGGSPLDVLTSPTITNRALSAANAVASHLGGAPQNARPHAVRLAQAAHDHVVNAAKAGASQPPPAGWTMTPLAAQTALKILGMYQGPLSGIVDTNTKLTVKLFQLQAQLNDPSVKVDGIVGPQTKPLLQQQARARLRSMSPAAIARATEMPGDSPNAVSGAWFWPFLGGGVLGALGMFAWTTVDFVRMANEKSPRGDITRKFFKEIEKEEKAAQKADQSSGPFLAIGLAGIGILGGWIAYQHFLPFFDRMHARVALSRLQNVRSSGNVVAVGRGGGGGSSHGGGSHMPLGMEPTGAFNLGHASYWRGEAMLNALENQMDPNAMMSSGHWPFLAAAILGAGAYAAVDAMRHGGWGHVRETLGLTSSGADATVPNPGDAYQSYGPGAVLRGAPSWVFVRFTGQDLATALSRGFPLEVLQSTSRGRGLYHVRVNFTGQSSGWNPPSGAIETPWGNVEFLSSIPIASGASGTASGALPAAFWGLGGLALGSLATSQIFESRMKDYKRWKKVEALKNLAKPGASISGQDADPGMNVSFKMLLDKIMNRDPWAIATLRKLRACAPYDPRCAQSLQKIKDALEGARYGAPVMSGWGVDTSSQSVPEVPAHVVSDLKRSLASALGT
jgi:hypothetical protein